MEQWKSLPDHKKLEGGAMNYFSGKDEYHIESWRISPEEYGGEGSNNWERMVLEHVEDIVREYSHHGVIIINKHQNGTYFVVGAVYIPAGDDVKKLDYTVVDRVYRDFLTKFTFDFALEEYSLEKYMRNLEEGEDNLTVQEIDVENSPLPKNKRKLNEIVINVFAAYVGSFTNELVIEFHQYSDERVKIKTVIG